MPRIRPRKSPTPQLRFTPTAWAKLLWRLRAPKVKTMRVPLMGIRKTLQGHRVASLMAFQMIEYIRRNAIREARLWTLETNEGHRSPDLIRQRLHGTVFSG